MEHTKEAFLKQFNALHLSGLGEVKTLYALKGDFINLEYHLPSGQVIKLWDDDKIYYGAEVCKPGSDRCFGLTADDSYLLVCEYGAGGSDADIVIYKRIDWNKKG